MPIVLKSGNLSLLEPSGPVQACNGTFTFTFTICSMDCNISVRSHYVCILFYAFKYIFLRGGFVGFTLISKRVHGTKKERFKKTPAPEGRIFLFATVCTPAPRTCMRTNQISCLTFATLYFLKLVPIVTIIHSHV